MSKARVVILASGSGTLTQAIIDAIQRNDLAAEVIAVISDQAGSGVLQRALSAGIKTQVIEMKSDRRKWDIEIISALQSHNPNFVISAGFMRILSAQCVAEFKIINSHPALLPLYPGANAVRDALADGAKVTGTTIHWVDSGVDTGEIIAQESVEITPTDTEATLHERIKIVERRLYVSTLQEILSQFVRSK